jgi:hypothetical protein
LVKIHPYSIVYNVCILHVYKYLKSKFSFRQD